MDSILRTIERVYPGLVAWVSLHEGVWAAVIEAEDGSMIPANAVRHIYWMIAAESKEWLISETTGIVFADGGAQARSIRLVKVGEKGG